MGRDFALLDKFPSRSPSALQIAVGLEVASGLRAVPWEVAAPSYLACLARWPICPPPLPGALRGPCGW